MTPEYMKLGEKEWVVEGDYSGWKDPEHPEEWFVTPLYRGSFQRRSFFASCWAGFPDVEGDAVLDRQYTYDARRFLDLSGHDWAMFRKNSRKFTRDHPEPLAYRRLGRHEREEEAASLLERWARGKEFQDPDAIVRFTLFGSIRWGLFQEDRLIGINVGDKNHLQAVYRYCVDDGTPYLNEFLRLCFYLDGWTQRKGWVNDGGDLGIPGLRAFKERLQPFVIETVYSTGTI